MKRLMLYFAFVVFLILAASALYLVTRLGSAFPLSSLGHGLLMLFTLLLALLMPALLILRRVSEVDLRWPLLLAYSVFGLFSILLAFTLFRDVLWLLARVVTLLPRDTAARALLFAYSSRIVLLAGTLVFVGGVLVARRPARLHEVDLSYPDLHPDLDGLRIVQLSDIHLDQTTRPELLTSIVSRTNELQPDFVALTGDLVDGRVSELSMQARALTELKAPCYFVSGNHELYSGYSEWCRFLDSIGVHVLDQCNELVTHKQAHLLITGVSDFSIPRMFPSGISDPLMAMSNAPVHDFCLLLAHQPSSAKAALAAGANLVLAGHTHGGQYFPFSSLIRFFQPYAKGLYHIGEAYVYTSPGTGTWGPPLRLGARHEITLIRLHRTRQNP